MFIIRDLLAPGRPEQMSASGRPAHALLPQPTRPRLPLHRIAAARAHPSPICLAPSRKRTPLPSASPCPARAPRLRPPLLPPDPFLSPRWQDPGARIRMSMPHPQDPRHTVRPICQPPARRAPSPSTWAMPHDSLNIPLKHETLAT